MGLEDFRWSCLPHSKGSTGLRWCHVSRKAKVEIFALTQFRPVPMCSNFVEKDKHIPGGAEPMSSSLDLRYQSP